MGQQQNLLPGTALWTLRDGYQKAPKKGWKFQDSPKVAEDKHEYWTIWKGRLLLAVLECFFVDKGNSYLVLVYPDCINLTHQWKQISKFGDNLYISLQNWWPISSKFLHPSFYHYNITQNLHKIYKICFYLFPKTLNTITQKADHWDLLLY